MVVRISSIKTMCLLLGFALAVAFAPPTNAASIVKSKHDFASAPAPTDPIPKPFSGTFEALGPGGYYETISEVCVFCHTPHHSNADAAGSAPLWNRSIPGTASGWSYKMYTSTTISSSLGFPTDAQGPSGISALCMSCHDGVTSVAVGTLLNSPGSAGPIDWTGNSGTDTGAIGDAIFANETSGWGANIGNAEPIDPGYYSSTIDLSNDHPISFNYPTGSFPGIKTPNPTDGRLRLFSGRVECATCHLVHDPAIPPFLSMPNDGSGLCLACHDI